MHIHIARHWNLENVSIKIVDNDFIVLGRFFFAFCMLLSISLKSTFFAMNFPTRLMATFE